MSDGLIVALRDAWVLISDKAAADRAASDEIDQRVEAVLEHITDLAQHVKALDAG